MPPRFPVIRAGKGAYPTRALGPGCRKRKVFEPHSFAVLGGGAMAGVDGFLHLTWHGAHDDGQGSDRDLYLTVPIVSDSAEGQFELYFCSTRCLRAFLGACVDRLEEKVARQRAYRAPKSKVGRGARRAGSSSRRAPGS